MRLVPQALQALQFPFEGEQVGPQAEAHSTLQPELLGLAQKVAPHGEQGPQQAQHGGVVQAAKDETLYEKAIKVMSKKIDSSCQNLDMCSFNYTLGIRIKLSRRVAFER